MEICFFIFLSPFSFLSSLFFSSPFSPFYVLSDFWNDKTREYLLESGGKGEEERREKRGKKRRKEKGKGRWKEGEERKEKGEERKEKGERKTKANTLFRSPLYIHSFQFIWAEFQFTRLRFQFTLPNSNLHGQNFNLHAKFQFTLSDSNLQVWDSNLHCQLIHMTRISIYTTENPIYISDSNLHCDCQIPIYISRIPICMSEFQFTWDKIESWLKIKCK